MKQRLEQLALYLPFDLKILQYDDVFTMTHISNYPNVRIKTIGIRAVVQHPGAKPIFHQLSDLSEQIERNGKLINTESFLSKHGLESILSKIKSGVELIDHLSYKDALRLAEWNFDLFRYIENDLAVDFNTIGS